MNKTKIEWVKNPDGTQGYTWNPITGCLNGCEYCYARRLAHGRLKERYLENQYFGDYSYQKFIDPFYPRFWPERIGQPYFYEKPCGIFVCDMGELFGDWVPRQWQEEIFDVIKSTQRHRFYLLTKQPQNLIKFSPFPDNCWVGVTTTDRPMYDRALLYLNNVEAKVKYISFEPLLEGIDAFVLDFLPLVNWVIIGAQTKPYKPPKIEWVEEISRACVNAGIPLFIKDNLRPPLEPHRIVVRQEMP